MTRFPQWISPRISLPVANLGEIPGKIAPRFLPPWICFSARYLVRFAVGFQRDFSCRDYSQLPGENLGELRGRIAPKFWPPGFLLLGENLGEIRGRILVRFWPPGFLLPAENLGEIRRTILARFWPPGSRRDSPSGKKNPGGQNLARIPVGFPPRFWRDPAKIPVLILPGKRLESNQS